MTTVTIGRRRVTREQIIADIKNLVESHSSQPCRVLVAPYGHEKAVFISFSDPTFQTIRWSVLYKAVSYTALRRKIRNIYRIKDKKAEEAEIMKPKKAKK